MAGASAGQRLCWASLLLVLFYSVGVIVFYVLERKNELETYAQNKELYLSMKKLYSFDHCKDPAFANLSFCKSQKEFSASLEDYFNTHGNSMEDLGQWTPLGCVFFLTHLSTTIGYGNSHPSTASGQLACIVFALIGIPIMGYTLAQVAKLDLKVAVVLLRKLGGVKMNTWHRQVCLLWTLLMFFLLAGACVYWTLEPWSYLHSLYFCFVTLSTVGFGDFLPSSPWSKVFTIFYTISGLGVCASIIAVLTGIVAEGHDSVDEFLKGSCPDCCGARDTTISG